MLLNRRPTLSSGGDSGARTRNLRLAKPALSQLSYIPGNRTLRLGPTGSVVGLGGLEPPTSRLSGVRSNQLSYRPTPGNHAEEFESIGTDGPGPLPSPWISRMRSEPVRPRVARIEPDRRAGQAQSQTQVPEKREE